MTSTAPLTMGVPLAKAQVICVFVHGRGQSPEAMQESVIQHLSAQGVAYILPRAPNGSWYDARAVDALTDDTRTALAGSLAQIDGLVSAAHTAHPHIPMVIGGFSQGACLALEYAFSNGPWNGALAAFTGCRVGTVSDDRPAKPLETLPVYLTGSDADPWIPLAAFADAAHALGRARARVRADIFPGRAHEPSPAEIAVLNTVLAELASGQTPTLEGRP